MNECLTTPQHEKQIGYWVSEKDKCMKWLYYDRETERFRQEIILDAFTERVGVKPIGPIGPHTPLRSALTERVCGVYLNCLQLQYLLTCLLT